MSEIEIKQMQEKINAGILLARKRLIEKTKKEDSSSFLKKQKLSAVFIGSIWKDSPPMRLLKT